MGIGTLTSNGMIFNVYCLLWKVNFRCGSFIGNNMRNDPCVCFFLRYLIRMDGHYCAAIIMCLYQSSELGRMSFAWAKFENETAGTLTLAPESKKKKRLLELMKIKNIMMKRKAHIRRTLSLESSEWKGLVNQGKTNGLNILRVWCTSWTLTDSN